MPIFETRIVARSLEDLRALGGLGLDLKHRAARQEDRNRFVVPAFLDDADIKRVKAAGYAVHVIQDLSAVLEARKREVTGGNRFRAARRVPDMAVRSVEGYLTPEEIEEALVNLNDQHPDLVETITLPHRTWEGRTSHAVRLGKPDPADRTALLFTGSMHAREWGGSDICVSFLIGLVRAYTEGTALHYGGKVFRADQVRAILDHLTVIVFPDVNPDGKHYSQTVAPMWRKNRNPNAGADPGHPGVDLNRNFDFLWHSGIGTSTDPASNIYRGEQPHSEPEIRNLLYLLDTFASIACYVDIHSYSQLILYSWGDDDNQSVDPQQNFANPEYDGVRGILEDVRYREYISPMDEIVAIGLAQRMNAALKAVRGGDGYTVQESSGLYPTTGTSTDYAFSRGFAEASANRIQGWTIEFGEEFIPPYDEMRKIIMEVGAAMTELCWSMAAERAVP